MTKARKTQARLHRRIYGKPADQTQTGGIDTTGPRRMGNGKFAFFRKPGSQNHKK